MPLNKKSSNILDEMINFIQATTGESLAEVAGRIHYNPNHLSVARKSENPSKKIISSLRAAYSKELIGFEGKATNVAQTALVSVLLEELALILADRNKSTPQDEVKRLIRKAQSL